MRYFIHLQYLGTRFHGWQVQPNDRTVQGEIQEKLKIYFRKETPIVGCGRTDTGVHSTKYFAHFDADQLDKQEFLFRIHKMLDKDIAILDVFEVDAEAHARYDAFSRSYEYQLLFVSNPFMKEVRYHYPYSKKPNIDTLNAVANELIGLHDFTAFSKVGSDVKSMFCEVKECRWLETEKGLKFEITANRFLRGMVRLLVGACLNTALGKLSFREIEEAISEQKPLSINWSVPAEGLALCDIKYPYSKERLC